MLTLTHHYTRAPRIHWRVVEGQAVLLDQEEAELLRLNPVGTVIWSALDGNRPVAAVIEEVTQTFEVPRTQAEADVLRFIKQLLKKDLLEESP